MKTINSFRSKLFALTLALTASVASFAYEFEYVNDFHINGFAYKVLPSNTLFPYGSAALIEIADCNKDVVIPEFVSYENTEYRIITFGMGSVVFTNNASSVVESITIPKTTSVINKNALAGCQNLKTVVVDSENPYYDSRENCNAIITTSQNPYFTPNTLIAGCKTTIIPNSVTEIGDNAFYNSALESITIPTGTTKIGRSAFNNSILLSSITLSATLIEISDWAFADCLSLNTIICYAIEPPTISSNTFFGSNPIYNNPTIYVPAESVEAYKNAEHWKWFTKVLPIEPTTDYKSQWCNKWNVMWFDGLFLDETASTSQYRLGKDTVIGNYTYSKLTSRTSVRFTSDRKVYVYYEGFDDNDPYTEDLPTGEYLAYDFSAQVGDTLEVFSGSHSYTTEQCVVYDVQTDPETNLRTIMLHPLCVIDGDGNVGVSDGEITWLEGVGSPNGFLISTPLPGGGSYVLLCAYKDDELIYTDSSYESFGCDYNAGVVSDDLFPTLSGLQRTICREYCEQADNKTRIEQFTNLTTRTETGAPYIYCSPFLLREKDNKILIYSRTLNKDLVLYDFNLQVGDSLPMLYIDFFAEDDWIADRDMEIWCVVDYHKDLEGNILPADTLIVTDVSAITLLDGKEYKKWTFNNGMEYVEGIGSFGNRQWSGDFFQLIANRDVPTSLHGEHLVCVSRNGQLLYQMDDAEMERLGAECLCQAEQKPEDLFPTLWGLQRTSFTEYSECSNSYASLFQSKGETITINHNQYLKFGGHYLREENKQVLLYSRLQDKDLVLYDYSLEVGDTLTTLNIDYRIEGIPFDLCYVDYAYEDVGMSHSIDTLIVTDVSYVTLLDGKEYKKWTFDNGMEYVEGIGNFGQSRWSGNFFGLVKEPAIPTCLMGEHLVCVSKNNKLLYQMDDAEMERLGAECLCDYDNGPRKDNAKNGKIGGRPTPTQWNMLEVDLREMEHGNTILRAETFSYTLENDSIVTNGKTFYQLARQSTKDTATTKSFVGALHFGEDEDNRVYFFRDGHEYVLYDFTAEPGDTLEIFAGINNYPQDSTYTHVVIGKDTIENGACRMTLEVVFPNQTSGYDLQKVWLAGLGSVDGIVHNAAKRTSNVHAAPSRSARNGDTQTSVMLCAWREDSCLYTTNHPDYDTFGCIYNQDPTALERPTSPSSYQKILCEGQLLIMHDGKIYTIMGLEIK